MRYYANGSNVNDTTYSSNVRILRNGALFHSFGGHTFNDWVLLSVPAGYGEYTVQVYTAGGQRYWHGMLSFEVLILGTVR